MTQRRFVGRTPDGWNEVEREGYSPDAPSQVVRRTLVGGRKASPEGPGPALEVRYFEVPPGSATRLERHEHEHYVVVGEGLGHAIVGEAVRPVGPRDVVYVAPGEPHQFVNRGSERFGFFCIVTAHRDAPEALTGEQMARLVASPAGAFIDPKRIPRPRTLG